MSKEQLLEQASAILRGGGSQSDIVRQLGVSKHWVTKHFKGQGWTPAQQGAARVKVDPQDLLRLYRETGDCQVVAERVGLNARTVQRNLQHLLGDDWPNKARVPVTPEQLQRIHTLAREGVPDGWVAEDVALTYETVNGKRRDAGIPASEDWKKTRLEIQHNPALFALHLEFAPPALRRG